MSQAAHRPRILYGTAWKEEDTTRLVRTALSIGFRAIDTANQPKHYQEALVGAALLEASEQGILRQDIFLQTKFTPADGQDHRIPYDPHADFPAQVQESFAASLKHLHTDYIDSYLLHGPYSSSGLTSADWAVWAAMEELTRAGKAKQIGVSNVNAQQLKLLIEKAEVRPSVVQNRCYASKAWDRAVRELCREANISYQGFSLLTANREIVHSSTIQQMAERIGRTAQQVIYRYSMQLGIVPLTGTTSFEHMQQALAAGEISLSADDVERLEALC